jgi:hypothetical protein
MDQFTDNSKSLNRFLLNYLNQSVSYSVQIDVDLASFDHRKPHPIRGGHLR